MKIHIIGAGISGLSAAWYLQKLGKVTLFEKSERVGGWIRTLHHEGFCFELGPRGFRPQGKGVTTIELCKQLGLQPLSASVQAKRRYVCHKGKLVAVTPLLLCKKGLLPALVRDFFVKPEIREDESVEQFFSRHFGRRFTDAMVDPLTKGIFGGDYRTLSAESCFPYLWQIDRSKGSLVRNWPKAEKGLPPLCSFPEGMELLVKRLAEKVDAEIKLHHTVEKSEADIVIWTTPQAKKFADIITVSMGWHKIALPKSGFGFLVPTAEGEPFLGMTWDSNVFPEQQGLGRLCVMMDKDLSDGQLRQIATYAVHKYVGISDPPDAVHIDRALTAIPQYLVGHQNYLASLQKSKKAHHYYIGTSIKGVGINDCIAQAKELASSLGAKW